MEACYDSSCRNIAANARESRSGQKSLVEKSRLIIAAAIAVRSASPI
jgi:hypothetical protein